MSKWIISLSSHTIFSLVLCRGTSWQGVEWSVSGFLFHSRTCTHKGKELVNSDVFHVIDKIWITNGLNSLFLFLLDVFLLSKLSFVLECCTVVYELLDNLLKHTWMDMWAQCVWTTYEHLKTFMNNSTNCSACCRVLLLFILYDVFPFNTLNIYFTFDMHAFSRSFYPKLIQAIHFFCFYQYVCSLGIEPTTFCTANTMLYHWATGTHHLFFIGT